MVWWLDCFLFSLSYFKWNVFMMRCYFASASDDAADYFFAIDDDGPLPQYIISHKIFSLLLLKILTPSHLMDLKSIRPSPYWKFCHSKSVQPSPVINFDIQRKTTKRFKEQEECAKLSWGLKTFEIRNSKHEFVDVIFHIFSNFITGNQHRT